MEERRSLPPYEDELSLALLRSADHDEPSVAAYSKAAAALGVSAAVGLGASVPAQAALVSNGLSGSVAARWSGSAFAKLVLVGISSVLLVGGVALLRHRLHPGARAQPAAHTAHAAEARAVAPPAPTLANAVAAPTPPFSLSQVPVPVVVPVPAPVAVRPSATLSLAANAGASASRSLAANAQSAAVSDVDSASVSSSSAVREPKVSTLPEQVASLDRARLALNAGDAGGALAEIAHYRSTWPRGVFLTEASVLEIQALAKRGEIVLAGMRAQAFVTAHPDSPQVERLRALIPHAAR